MGMRQVYFYFYFYFILTYKDIVMAIKKCNCKSLFQDRKYGKDLRIMNPLSNKGKSGTQAYRCTVCNTEK